MPELSKPDTELLPCPFCGAAPRTDLMPNGTIAGWIQCSQCRCERSMFETPDEAIADWNTRAVINAQSTQLELMRESFRAGQNHASVPPHDSLPVLKPAAGNLTVECPLCHQDVSETRCGAGNYKDCYHYTISALRHSQEEKA